MFNPERAPQPEDIGMIPDEKKEIIFPKDKPLIEKRVSEPETPREKEIREKIEALPVNESDIEVIATKIPGSPETSSPKPKSESSPSTSSNYEAIVKKEQSGFLSKAKNFFKKTFGQKEVSQAELNKIHDNLERLEKYCIKFFADVNLSSDVWEAKKEGITEIIGQIESQIYGKSVNSPELTQKIERRLVNLRAALQNENARNIWIKDRPGAEHVDKIRTDDLVETPPEIFEEDIVSEEETKVA